MACPVCADIGDKWVLTRALLPALPEKTSCWSHAFMGLLMSKSQPLASRVHAWLLPLLQTDERAGLLHTALPPTGSIFDRMVWMPGCTCSLMPAGCRQAACGNLGPTGCCSSCLAAREPWNLAKALGQLWPHLLDLQAIASHNMSNLFPVSLPGTSAVACTKTIGCHVLTNLVRRCCSQQTTKSSALLFLPACLGMQILQGALIC
jgi:hypothetical protein